MAIVCSPRHEAVSQRCFCSSVPKNWMTRIGPVLHSKTWKAAGRQTLASSSMTTRASTRVPPWPPYSSGMAKPR